MKRIKASFMFSLIFCSIFLAAFSYSKLEVKAAKQVVFEDDFESYTAGVFPSSGGWELWFDGEGIEYQVILENVSFSPTKSLKLLGVDSWAAFATKGFTSTSPLIGFEVAVRVADVNGGSQDNARVAFTKKVSGPISCEYAPVTFQDSGTINSGGQVLQFYEADRWYKITLIMDRSSDAYNVWVDDELRGENLNVTTTSDSLSSNPTSGIEAFSVSQCYNGVTAYFDDVKIFSFFETNPRLELVPIWGIATTTLVGSGFTPNSRISVTLNGNAIPTVPSPLFTGDYGNFKGIISVLNQVEGEYTVRAVDEMGDAATAIFTVPGGPQGQDQLVVPDDYPTIQEAMNHAKEGATMLVKAGTYYENVVVNKPLTIKSQGGAENTIVRTPDPNSGKNVFEVWADDVEITGFTIEGSTNRTVPGDLFDPASYVDACGIYIGTCSGTKITSNIVRNNFEGIVFTDCSNILASENQVVDNIHEGVRIVYSSSATLIKNSIISTHDPEYVASTGLAVFQCTNSEVLENRIDAYINGAVISNSQGITFSNNNVTNNRFHGLNIVNGNGHKIFRNTLKKNTNGISPSGATNTQIYENTLQENEYGLAIYSASNNFIYHNYFINNLVQANNFHGNEVNSWDNGIASGGNYWSDYNGTDADGDGIGNIPYVIDGNNQDNYPLMNPWCPPPPRFYKLIVDSNPSGATFTVDNATYTTPWSIIYNGTTSFSLAMPESSSIEGENYIWSRWSDGNTKRNRTVTVDKNTALSAMYRSEDTSLRISILSPENKTYSSIFVPLKIIVNKVFYSTSYSFDGQANIMLIGNTTLNGLPEGPHSIKVYLVEYPTNATTSRTVYFTVDTTPPILTDVKELRIEVNGTDFGTKVNATVTDAVRGVEWVALNYTDGNGTWMLSEMTNLEGDIWNGTISAFPHGTNVTYIIVARDIAQNIITSQDLLGHPNQYEVLPEMLPWMILPLFLIATAFTLAVKKRISSQTR